MAKLRINGDSSGYVDLEAPNAASSSTLDLDQVPQKNAANTFSAVNNFTGNIGINRSTPQSKFEAWTGNGELSHFGSNNANATNNYTGISLGYAEAGANSNYRKVGIVAVGRGDGAARQDLAFLVDSNSDGNSVDLGDTKMRISHEGYVTTPSQPSFNAQRTTNQGIQGGTTLIFDQARHNTGNHYNTSTGVFTAPIAGDYLFTFKSLFYAFASSEYLDLYSTVNGTTRNRYEQTGNNGQHTQIDYTEVVRLNVNDTFYLYSTNRNSSVTHYSMYGNENHFSGYLLG